MKKVLLDRKKPFYKANLHCHSVCSDGRLTPSELKEEYKKRGYSVLAITDHEHLLDNSALNDKDFLTITSCEVAIKEFPTVSTSKKPDMRAVHLNFYALDPHNTITPCYSSEYDYFVKDFIKDKIRFSEEYKRENSVKGINEIIRKANENGFIVSYNHPTWSLDTAENYLQYDGLFAVEIYNHDIVVAGGRDDEHILDDLWSVGKPVFCTACDDNHDKSPIGSPYNDSFGGWVQINSAKLTYNEIMACLKRGDFYASTGPEIYSLTVERDKVKIEFSGCVKATLVTATRRRAAVIAESGQSVSFAEFAIKASDRYFRIVITDSSGNKAYTQFYTI